MSAMIVLHCPEISPGHADPAVGSAVLPLQQQHPWCNEHETHMRQTSDSLSHADHAKSSKRWANQAIM